jgi:hypothetical protein
VARSYSILQMIWSQSLALSKQPSQLLIKHVSFKPTTGPIYISITVWLKVHLNNGEFDYTQIVTYLVKLMIELTRSPSILLECSDSLVMESIQLGALRRVNVSPTPPHQTLSALPDNSRYGRGTHGGSHFCWWRTVKWPGTGGAQVLTLPLQRPS